MMVLVNDSGNDHNGVGVENHDQDCDSKKSSDDHLVHVVKKQKSGTKEERPTTAVVS